MSIINEALKKAEGAKGFKPLHGGDKSRQNIELEVHKRSKQINWGPIFVLLVLFLITGPLVAPVFTTTFKPSGHGITSMPPTTKASYLVPAQTDAPLAALPPGVGPETRKAQFGLEEMPRENTAGPKLFLPATAPKLNLTGVMYSQEDSYGIINGKVVKVGEETSGAKLLSVKPHEVKLLYQGEEITLAIPE